MHPLRETPCATCPFHQKQTPLFRNVCEMLA
uniref:Uncharacterized protein n=1 Tax=Anguilla anguilla TaxID=7936 RepID=A0A0E9PFR2_ANGAN